MAVTDLPHPATELTTLLERIAAAAERHAAAAERQAALLEQLVGSGSPTHDEPPASRIAGASTDAPPRSDALLDYESAAAFLGMPKGTLYNMVYEKKVPHVRLGPKSVRFDPADLRRWLANRRVRPR